MLTQRPRKVASAILRPFRERLTRVVMSRPYELRVAEPGSLAGTTAVVTGGSGTIGRAIVLHLAAHGAHVHAIGRDAQKLSDVARDAEKVGGTCTTARVDLADDDEITAFFAGLGRIDILVNCAGGSSRGQNGPVWTIPLSVIDRVLAINLRAAIACTRAASAAMIAQHAGRIINVGSVIAHHGKAGFADYAAAKAGLVGYSRSAAIELGPHGVTVNCVSPGIVLRGEPTLEEIERVRETNVLHRMGRAEDVAQAVVFLAGPGAAFITGQDLTVDGGRSLGLRGDD